MIASRLRRHWDYIEIISISISPIGIIFVTMIEYFHNITTDISVTGWWQASWDATGRNLFLSSRRSASTSVSLHAGRLLTYCFRKCPFSWSSKGGFCTWNFQIRPFKHCLWLPGRHSCQVSQYHQTIWSFLKTKYSPKSIQVNSRTQITTASL